MAAKADALWTAAEYAKLDERVIDGIWYRDELIEGEQVLAPFPMTPHVVVVKNLERLLEKQFLLHRVVREAGWHFQSPTGRDNVPGPDLMVLSAGDYEDSLRGGRWFEGKPLFVVEVISPSERRAKRLQKVGLYLEAGAGAVVEVELTKQVVLVYRPEDPTPEIIRAGRMEWPFEVALPEIFAGVNL
jgi:Uma2 family endonuclease